MFSDNMQTNQNRLANSLPLSYSSNVFLLDPKNLSFLNKTGRLSVALNFANTFLLLAFIGLAVSCIILLQGATELIHTSRLINDPATAQAEITKYRHSDPGPDQGYLYRITYRFLPSETSSILTKDQFVHKDIFDSLEDGSVVTIKYLSDDPDVSMMAGINAESGFEAHGFVIAVIGLVGVVISSVYLLPYLWQLFQIIRLRRKGQVITGQILYCRRYMALNPETGEYDATLVKNLYIELSYRFHTENGKEIRGMTRYKRNDLKGKHLPQFGMPVAVLYLNPKTYRVL